MKDYSSHHEKAYQDDNDSDHWSRHSSYNDTELFGSGLRPREGAEPVSFGRDKDTGRFDGGGGDPVPFERGPDSGQFGLDPYAVGNFGQFNSPYKSKDEEDKYG